MEAWNTSTFNLENRFNLIDKRPRLFDRKIDTESQPYCRQIRNHLVAPLHTCPFFNIVILVEIWHAIHV